MIAVALLNAFLIIHLASAAAFSSPVDPAVIGGTNVFVMTGSPTPCMLSGQYCYQATYTNNLNITVVGIVFFVIHNQLGQTVEYSTGTINVTSGHTATAYPVIYGIAPGNYSGTLFVTSTGGTSISDATKVNLTIP